MTALGFNTRFYANFTILGQSITSLKRLNEEVPPADLLHIQQQKELRIKEAQAIRQQELANGIAQGLNDGAKILNEHNQRMWLKNQQMLQKPIMPQISTQKNCISNVIGNQVFTNCY